MPNGCEEGIQMSEEDLELLVTMDDPGEERQEDTFKHLQAEDTLQYWLGQTFSASCRLDQPVSNNIPCTVVFGQGDWTCTVSRLTGTTNDAIQRLDENTSEAPLKQFDIEVCRVTRRRHGEIVEEKVFYDLVGMRKQFEGM
jgi:hypothetical protein